jgi:plastocyanin
MFARTLLLLLLPLAACSGDAAKPTVLDAPGIDPRPIDAASTGDAARAIDAAPIDAPPIDARPIDAPPSPVTVVAVTCPASGVPVVATSGFSFSPASTTIAVDGIVKFTMPSSHNVVPATGPTDDGLRVDFNETKCLKFTKAGTFNFKCQPHGFTGSITVN